MLKYRVISVLLTVVLMLTVIPFTQTASAGSEFVTPGTNISGYLPNATSNNMYYFTLTSGGYVSLSFTTPSFINTYSWYVRLLDLSSNQILSGVYGSDGTISGSYKTKTSEKTYLEAGTYYVIVSCPADTLFSSAYYSLNIQYSGGGTSGNGSNGSGGNGTIATAAQIQPNTSYSGTLENAYDAKMYKFTLSSSGSVQLKFTVQSDIDLGNWMIFLYDSNERELLSGRAGNGGTVIGKERSNLLEKLRLPAGTYYIAVLPYSTSTFNNTQFQITALFTPEASGYYETEYNNSKETANTIQLNYPVTANIGGADDIDYFKFNLSAQSNISIRFETPNNIISNFWVIDVFSDTENLYTSYAGQSGVILNNKRMFVSEAITLPAGNYYVVVHAYDRKAYSNEDYTLTVLNANAPVPPLVPEEKPQTTENVPVASYGVNVNRQGKLTSGYDSSVYEFGLAHNGSVTIRFQSGSQYNRIYWNVKIFDDKNNELYYGKFGEGGEVSSDWRISYSDKIRLPAGVYYMEVTPVNTYSYSSSVYYATIAYIDEYNTENMYETEFNNTTYTASPLNPNKQIIGNMSSNADVDYYKLHLDKKGSLTLNITTPVSVSSNCWIVRIMDSSYNIMYESSFGASSITEGSTRKFISEKLRLQAGDYYVFIGAYSSIMYSNADYTLTAVYSEEDSIYFESEPNNIIATANNMYFNTSLTGNLSGAGDVDYFTVTLKKFEEIQIKFSIDASINVGHWIVKLFNSQGKELKSYRLGEGGTISLNGIRSCKTEKIPLEVGKYYIAVFPYSVNEYSSKDYTLKVLDSAGQKSDGLIYVYDAPAAWAKEDVEAAYGYGLIPAGYMRSFSSSLTREEFCTLATVFLTVVENKPLAEILAARNITINQNAFTDTKEYVILAAHALGLVEGKSGGIFDPSGLITRQEAAVMLMRLGLIVGININVQPRSFSDHAEIASWASSAVSYVSGCADNRNSRIMDGYNNMFHPNDNISREQAFITLYRLFNCR